MARTLIRATGHDRERSLGWLAITWIEHFLQYGRGGVVGMPVRLTDEAVGFIVDCYYVPPVGLRQYDSAFYSRPKGADKSGIASYIALFEALGPARPVLDDNGEAVLAKGGEVYRDPYGLGFSYTYVEGEPLARHVRQPVIRCMATEEGQASNTYDTIFYNLTQGPLARALDHKDAAGKTKIELPAVNGGGKIIPSTASAASKDGGLETFNVIDESHLYITRELRDAYTTLNRNLAKRKKSDGTWMVETTTMYAPGEESMAEETYKVARLIEEGKAKRERLVFDHRWGDIDPEEMGDEDKLRAALEEAYGDATAWVDIDGIIDQIYDPRSGVQDSLRYFLNSLTSSENAWMQYHVWRARDYEFIKENNPEFDMPYPAKGDTIALGFDGSRSRARGVTDATALIATRIKDGLQWEIGVWEQPTGALNWAVPVEEVDAAVQAAFDQYDVVAFYADPAKWETRVAEWEAKYASKLKVRASQAHPIQWWMTASNNRRTVEALEEYRNAVIEGEQTHLSSPVLTRHVLAARMVAKGTGVQIAKENPHSERKIDAAVAAVISWRARIDALAKGYGKKTTTFVPYRIR